MKIIMLGLSCLTLALSGCYGPDVSSTAVQPLNIAAVTFTGMDIARLSDGALLTVDTRRPYLTILDGREVPFDPARVEVVEPGGARKPLSLWMQEVRGPEMATTTFPHLIAIGQLVEAATVRGATQNYQIYGDPNPKPVNTFVWAAGRVVAFQPSLGPRENMPRGTAGPLIDPVDWCTRPDTLCASQLLIGDSAAFMFTYGGARVQPL